MSTESRCSTCGSKLPIPGQPCPFCAEARKLLQHLAVEEEVRLCSRCGTILQPDDGEVCKECQQRLGPAPVWRREDRIARWIRDRFVETESAEQAVQCPRCGQPVLPLDAYCAHCGANLAQLRKERQIEESLPVTAVPAQPTAEAMVAGTSISPQETPASPVENATASPVERSISQDSAEPSFWQQFQDSLREQFRPVDRGQGPAPPFWQQMGGFLRSLVQPARPTGSQVWLWVLVGVIIVGLVVVVILWVQMLSSGGIVLR